MNSCGSAMFEQHFDMVNANVLDRYKGMAVEEIKADLNTRRSPIIIAFENIQGDFNLSTAIRNTNAFCGEAVIVLGKRRYDKRGAVGTHHYENVIHCPDYSILEEYKNKGYKIVAAENDMKYNPVPLHNYKWNDKTVIIFGEENRGLSPELIAMCDEMVYVPQLGSVRSMNVGTISGIFLYHYSVKMGRLS